MDGGADSEQLMNQEVDDKLSQGILAMSIDRLKSEFCKPVILTFRNEKIEEKVSFTY